jgi:HD-like signal output (HDOD) protein
MSRTADVIAPRTSCETILEHARALPASPQVLAGLGELLQDINTDLETIATQIRVEPALAARVIRMSNSAVFGSGQRVGSVDEAVNRVGFGEVLRLVGAATVSSLVDRALGCYGIAAPRLRESLLMHALASEALATQAGIDERTAYSAGLLRATGMMVLERVGRAQSQPTTGFEGSGFSAYADWETARFGITGSEATAAILEAWRFPAGVVTAQREHLCPDAAGSGDRLAYVLNLAGAIVLDKGLALAGEKACWPVTPEKLAGAGIDHDRFQTAAAQAGRRFERHRDAL